MGSAQVGFRQKGEDKCIHHPGQKLTFQCDNCSCNLVCNTCVSTIHRGHNFKDIKFVVKGKVKKINSFIHKTSKEIIPKITDEIRLTTKRLQEIEKKYSNAIKEIEKQRDILYSEIELMTSSLIALFESKHKENKEALERHMNVLEKLQKELEKTIGECEKVVQSGTDISVCDTEAYINLRPEVSFPQPPSLNASTFSPCKFPKSHIEEAFLDSLDVKPLCVNDNRPGHKSKRSVTSNQHETKQNYQIIYTKTVHKRDLPYSIKYNGICPTPIRMTWVHGDDDNIHLVDDTGIEQRTLTLDVEARSITTHPITGDLYCSSRKDNSSRRVNAKTGETTVMFITDIAPCSIACTKDDHMVVGSYNRVRTYTFIGQVLHEYTFTSICCPYISVCKISNHVAVALRNDGVLLLNNSLQELYTYTGQDGGQGGHMDRKNLKCYTTVFVDRYLLIGDYNNDVISVISALDGFYVRTIHTKKLRGVLALGAQQNGCLLVGCNESMLCINHLE